MTFEKPAIQKFIAQAQLQSYQARQLVMRADRSSDLYLLLEGSVSVIAQHQSGRQAVLGYLHPGEFFGEIALNDKPVDSGVLVRARTPVVAARMSTDVFTQLVTAHPELALILAAQLTTRLRRAQAQIADLSFLDVTQRLKGILLQLAQQPDATHNGRGTVIRITDQELALLVGCSREMVSRAMKSLESAGHIVTSGKTIMIGSGVRAPHVSETPDSDSAT